MTDDTFTQWFTDWAAVSKTIDELTAELKAKHDNETDPSMRLIYFGQMSGVQILQTRLNRAALNEANKR